MCSSDLSRGPESDGVLQDQPGVAKQILEKIGPVKLGLNAVGGSSSKEVMKSLSPHGVMVTYGAMSRQPCFISNSALIYHMVTSTGFNRSRWIEEACRNDVIDGYKTILEFLKCRPITIPVQAIYPLAQYRDAFDVALAEGRMGKVLLRL